VKEQSYYWIGLNIVAGGPMQTWFILVPKYLGLVYW